jgi:hypothetical protein
MPSSTSYIIQIIPKGSKDDVLNNDIWDSGLFPSFRLKGERKKLQKINYPKCNINFGLIIKALFFIIYYVCQKLLKVAEVLE